MSNKLKFTNGSHSDDETLDNTSGIQSENLSDEIIPANPEDIINANQEIDNIEVHHHPLEAHDNYYNLLNTEF